MSAQHPADRFDVGRIVNDLFTTHLPKATRQMPDERVTHDQLRQRHDRNDGGCTGLEAGGEFPFQKHRPIFTSPGQTRACGVPARINHTLGPWIFTSRQSPSAGFHFSRTVASFKIAESCSCSRVWSPHSLLAW